MCNALQKVWAGFSLNIFDFELSKICTYYKNIGGIHKKARLPVCVSLIHKYIFIIIQEMAVVWSYKTKDVLAVKGCKLHLLMLYAF
jgi:hypothetical protein